MHTPTKKKKKVRPPEKETKRDANPNHDARLDCTRYKVRRSMRVLGQTTLKELSVNKIKIHTVYRPYEESLPCTQTPSRHGPLEPSCQGSHAHQPSLVPLLQEPNFLFRHLLARGLFTHVRNHGSNFLGPWSSAPHPPCPCTRI